LSCVSNFYSTFKVFIWLYLVNKVNNKHQPFQLFCFNILPSSQKIKYCNKSKYSTRSQLKFVKSMSVLFIMFIWLYASLPALNSCLTERIFPTFVIGESY
jgi:hypothetical protein